MIDIIYPVGNAPVMKGAKITRSIEMLPVIDTDGIVIAQASRSFCHGAHRPLHPVVHLHIVNRQGDIYLQKRSMTKKLLPGKWDTAVGGHISYGESVLEALVREAGEELGFFDFNPIEMDRYIFESEVEKEKSRILDYQRKKTTQKVNLYEKVQIPGYQEAIRKIKRFMEDEENLSKASSKIVKERHALEEEEEML